MESESENQNANVADPPAENQNTDDDVVEVEVESGNASAMSKRRLSADVWKEFNMLPPGPDKKQRCSCKRCGATYACPSTYGTGTSTQRRGDPNMCENIFANEAEDVMKELDEYENDESFISTKKTQLELYLEEPKFDRKANLNVLDFWKGNRFRYPELAAMACDILSIPITTVASESAFSAGGRVLNKYRTSLLPQNAESLICARDWLYGEKATLDLKDEELCEDILNLDLNKDESGTGS